MSDFDHYPDPASAWLRKDSRRKPSKRMATASTSTKINSLYSYSYSGACSVRRAFHMKFEKKSSLSSEYMHAYIGVIALRVLYTLSPCIRFTLIAEIKAIEAS